MCCPPLAPYAPKGDGVTVAISYYTTHQGRMQYPDYRARGLQIGSGTIESACKQLVSARLKLVGMIWHAAGAEAVAVVRAWLTSDRWSEAMGLRPPVMRPENWSSDNVRIPVSCLGRIPGVLEGMRSHIPQTAMRALGIIDHTEGREAHPRFRE